MLRLPHGSVTVLLGSALARRRVMAHLDDSSGRCASGHDAVVFRLTADEDDSVPERLAALDAVRDVRASIVLVDRFTDGLTPHERRAVLTEAAAVAAADRAVLVDDIDPVAALAVATAALRIDPTGRLVVESVGDLDYLAS